MARHPATFGPSGAPLRPLYAAPTPDLNAPAAAPWGDDALAEALAAAQVAAAALLRHPQALGPAAGPLRAAFDQLGRSAAHAPVRLALFGEARAGKRSLMDAFIGERLLAAGPRGLRLRLHHAEAPTWTARLGSGERVDSRIAVEEARLAEAAQHLRALRAEVAQAHTRAHQLHNQQVQEDRHAQEAVARAREVAADRAEALRAAAQAAQAAQEALRQAEAARSSGEAALPGFLIAAEPGLLAQLLAFLFGWLWSAPRAALPGLKAAAAAAREQAAAAQQASQARNEAHNLSALELEALRSRQAQIKAARAEAARVAVEADSRLTAAGADEADARQRLQALREGRGAALRQEVAALLNNPRAGTIAELEIGWPSLPDGVCLIDEGALLDPDPTLRAAALEALRPAVDAWALCAPAGQRLGAAVLDQAQSLLAEGVGLVALFTQADRHPPAADAVPALAETLGCPADHLWTLPLSAAAILSGEAGRQPLRDLLTLARQDRALRRCAAAAQALLAAEAALPAQRDRAQAQQEARRAALAAARIPDAAAFLDARRPILDLDLTAARATLAERAAGLARAQLEALHADLLAELRAQPDREAVYAWVGALPAALSGRVSAALAEAHPAEALADAGLTLELSLTGPIHARYDLADRATSLDHGPRDPRPAPAWQGSLPAAPDPRRSWKAGGAAAGALLGSLLFPGLGTVFGAWLGAQAHKLLPRDEQIAQQERALHELFAQQIPALASQAASQATAALEALAATLPSRGIAEIGRLHAWIDQEEAHADALLAQAQERLRAAASAREAAHDALVAIADALRPISPQGGALVVPPDRLE